MWPPEARNRQYGNAVAVGEPRGQRMRFQMVDRDQRLVVHQRDCFGRGQPDDHAADQAGSGGRGDAVEGGERHLRLAHRLCDDGIERLDMGAGGDFRHDAAEFGMFADLRQDDIGQDAAAPPSRSPLDHGGGRFVAGRFDAENDHRCIIWVAVIAARAASRQ